MGLGWEGEKVRLVPLDKDRHFENCVQWINDPDVTAWTLIGDFPLTRLAEEDYFNNAMSADAKDVNFAVETLDGEHIGMTGITQIDYRHGVGTTGSLIGRKDLWGQGYGTDSIRVRMRYAFDVLGLRMLLSVIMSDNVGSLKAVQKCGYREVGRIPRRFWKRGAYRDAVILIAERETRQT